MNKLSANRKIFNYMLVITLLNTIAIAFLDQPYINAESLPLYLKIQSVTAVFLVSLLIINNLYSFNPKFLLFFIIYALVYGCIGQFFIASSYVTVIMALFSFAVFLDIYAILFCIISLLSCSSMIACIWISGASYATDPVWIEKYKVDSSQTLILMTIFITIVQYIRSKDKLKNELIESKLLNLGNQTLFFIHDLKNKITPPLNNILFLNKQINKSPGSSDLIREVGSEIENDLLEIKDYIMSINQTNAFKTDIRPLALTDLVNSIKATYKEQLSGISIEVAQKGSITIDISLVNAIITNAITNAQQNFSRKNIENKKIWVVLEDRSLKIIDNGGGFVQNTIDNFNNNSFFTDKEEGSGVGFMIMKKYAETLKWKVNLYNNKENNAVIEFKLGKT